MKKYKQLKRYALAASLCLCFFGATTASFANNISIGRYLVVAEKPQQEQQRLLNQQIQIKFPQNILTIQEAVEFVLQYSGYRLTDLKFGLKIILLLFFLCSLARHFCFLE